MGNPSLVLLLATVAMGLVEGDLLEFVVGSFVGMIVEVMGLKIDK